MIRHAAVALLALTLVGTLSNANAAAPDACNWYRTQQYERPFSVSRLFVCKTSAMNLCVAEGRNLERDQDFAAVVGTWDAHSEIVKLSATIGEKAELPVIAWANSITSVASTIDGYTFEQKIYSDARIQSASIPAETINAIFERRMIDRSVGLISIQSTDASGTSVQDSAECSEVEAQIK